MQPWRLFCSLLPDPCSLIAGGWAHDGDQLLAENVERIAREAGRLDVAFVHRPGHGGTGDQVGAVFGKQNAFAHRIDGVAGAANALHAAGDRGRRFDLDDEIDGSHVDAEFKGRRRAECFDLAGLELLFDHGALVGGERAVVGAGDRFAGKIVQRASQSLGNLAAVDEQNGGIALANKFEQTRMNGVPDRDATRRLRGGPAGDFLHRVQVAPYLQLELQCEALTASDALSINDR